MQYALTAFLTQLLLGSLVKLGVVKKYNDPKILLATPRTQPYRMPAWFTAIYALSIFVSLGLWGFLAFYLARVFQDYQFTTFVAHVSDRVLFHSPTVFFFGLLGSFFIAMIFIWFLNNITYEIFPAYGQAVLAQSLIDFNTKYAFDMLDHEKSKITEFIFTNVDFEKARLYNWRIFFAFIPFLALVSLPFYYYGFNDYFYLNSQGYYSNHTKQLTPWSDITKAKLDFVISSSNNGKKSLAPNFVLETRTDKKINLWKSFDVDAPSRSFLIDAINLIYTNKITFEYSDFGDDKKDALSLYNQQTKDTVNAVLKLLEELYPKEPALIISDEQNATNTPVVTIAKIKEAQAYWEQGFDSWITYGDPEKAKVFYKKSLEAYPDYPPALSSYGSIIANFDEKYDEGEKMLRRAMELDPTWAYAPFNLGILYNLKGDREQGLYWLKYTIDTFPNHPDIEHFKNMYYTSKDYYEESSK